MVANYGNVTNKRVTVEQTFYNPANQEAKISGSITNSNSLELKQEIKEIVSEVKRS
jgi:hypothetical protein